MSTTKWAAQHTAGHDTHGQTAIYDEATGKDVAIVYDGDAHAELIVRAVNSHADILEALEELHKAADAMWTAIGNSSKAEICGIKQQFYVLVAATKKAEAAIAHAKEGAA